MCIVYEHVLMRRKFDCGLPIYTYLRFSKQPTSALPKFGKRPIFVYTTERVYIIMHYIHSHRRLYLVKPTACYIAQSIDILDTI